MAKFNAIIDLTYTVKNEKKKERRIIEGLEFKNIDFANAVDAKDAVKDKITDIPKSNILRIDILDIKKDPEALIIPDKKNKKIVYKFVKKEVLNG